MKKLNVAYFGTPYFSALFLEKMIQDTSLPIEIQLVVTRPDKPVGRKQVTTSSPVKQIALKKNIPVFDNLQSLKATDSLFNTCNIAFLYAYRGIIPKDLLNKPTFGFFNTHPSLLPKYRGPSPIAYPLMYGDIQTGVTLIKLDEEIDHGPIIMQEQIPILPTDRRPDLEMKLTDLTYLLFSKLVNSLTRESFNNLFFSPQDDKKATFTRLLEKKDGFIPFSVLQKVLKNEPLSQNELPQIIQENWKSKMINDKSISNFKFQISNSSKIIYDYFRGMYPWPGIWTYIQPTGLNWDHHKRLKITDMDLQGSKLIIKKVQLEGKNEVDFKTFQTAYNLFTP